MTLLIEVKAPTGKLNVNEQKFHDDWRGQIAVCRTIEEAVRLAERYRDQDAQQRLTQIAALVPDALQAWADNDRPRGREAFVEIGLLANGT